MIAANRPHPLRDPALVAVLGAALLVCLPFAHFVHWFGDEGVLLQGASRMMAGEALYRDVFAIVPPGGYLVVEAWLKLIGESLVAERALVMLMVALTAGAIYLGSMALFKARLPSALLAIAWLVDSQGAWTVMSHHAIVTLLSMAAALVVSSLVARNAPAPRMASVAGLLAGSAAMVTQTRGGLAVLACLGALLLCRRSRQEVLALTLGAIVPALAALVWLGAHGTLRDAFECVIRWPAKNYAAIQGVPYGAFATAQTLPAVVLFPALLVLFAVCSIMSRGAVLADPRRRAWVPFAVAGFLGVHPRPDAVHIAYAAPLAIPLFAACLQWLGARAVGASGEGGPRRSLGLAVGVLLAVACAPSAIAFFGVARDARLAPRVATPRGEVALGAFTDPGNSAGLITRLSTIPPDAPIFFYPYDPLLTWLLGRRQVGRFDILKPHYSPPADYRAACEAALSRARWVVFDRRWSDRAMLKAVFPTLVDADPPEKQAMEAALERAFTPSETFGSSELRQRAPGASPDPCRTIPAT